MIRFILTILIIILLAGDAAAAGESKAAASFSDDDFNKNCKPSRCGRQEIRFPLRLNSSSSYCGAPGLELSCAGGEITSLNLPHIESVKVLSIDYKQSLVEIQFDESWAICPLKNLSLTNFTGARFQPYASIPLSLISCLTKFDPDDQARITGPIACINEGGGGFVYAAYSQESMDILAPDCEMMSNGGEVPFNGQHSWKEEVENFIKTRKMEFTWREYEENSKPTIAGNCSNCEEQGKTCVFSLKKQAYCINRHHGPPARLIAGPLVGGLLPILVVISIVVFLKIKSDKEIETRLKVERFLASYHNIKPTRYSFAAVKNITKRFKNKLGQGGYGTVYKGVLPTGIPVAVKMLERSKGEGEDFINEVATIGRIHHVNVVRLLGFCADKSRRALIYEFLPNESLEKYIFSREPKGTQSQRPLNTKQLLKIAIGIARGIEYLHQGCDERILHFDIKPHNILLDHEFSPKVSDFGLAKLCSKDQSIVTMTAARGTMGYIAPEIYSRNFGSVSYKSDVYSYGMLILEMVGGRRNTDPDISNQSELYLPETVYDRLIQGHDLGLNIETEAKEDEEVVKKLATVALWCIQWNPTDRPSMSSVLQMLIGNSQNLKMPPKPFISAMDRGYII